MGAGISHGDRGFRCYLLLNAERVPDLRGVFHVELQPVTDNLGERWSRQEARVHAGKDSCGPENPGGHDERRDTAQGAVEGLRHQVIKVHPESAPDRCLAVGPRVPGKADAWPKIFVRTLEPRVADSRFGVGQGISKVGDLAIDFRRDRRELVPEPQVQSKIGASLEVILEIKSEQVLAPASNGIAAGDVIIELSSSSYEEIIQGVKEILPAVHAG